VIRLAQIYDSTGINRYNPNEMMGWRAAPGLVKIMLSSLMLLLKVDPTFIPHRFWILDFRIRI
jgi:hypothetical protein